MDIHKELKEANFTYVPSQKKFIVTTQRESKDPFSGNIEVSNEHVSLRRHEAVSFLRFVVRILAKTKFVEKEEVGTSEDVE